ncbi:glycosyltransferase family 39 protein [Planktothrix mougeotii]|uniref:Glycosyltransferase family 39 protein n=1 Tax=Planktothrix mougeotii LEGE 06226 TaxID=1828728 RepID=A0ABR9UB36_9CYAN|nr:glycosyltransferase family 39 protein [Planktothrix mougeotii]MBE9143668.1 glycosyltransferase family 39 protein [Planktothrix mougeotii LEGE 06226]
MKEGNKLGFFPKSLSLETLLIAAIIISIFIRVLNLGTREFWYDEVLSLLLSTGQKTAYVTPKDVPVVLANYTLLLNLPPESSFSDILRTLVSLLKGIVAEPHPFLFYISQHFWLRLFGNSEIAQRSLNTLLSLFSIGCGYGFGRTLFGYRGGLLFAALLATNPFFLFHSLNVRMYAPLVLWTILSAWALIQLMGVDQIQPQNTLIEHKTPLKLKQQLFWTGVLIASVVAGCLTFYLFAYWVITLAALVLYLDRHHWWQHALRLGTGVLITVPWVLWGTRQQLRNADLGRFSTPPGFFATMVQHLQDVAYLLGVQLGVGDWITSIPVWVAVSTGIFWIIVFTIGSIRLWKLGEHRRLGTVLILGIFPLFLALLADIVGKKFTIGFGWGRSLMIILPGCLLLITLLIQGIKKEPLYRLTATGLILVYLTISIGDYSLRPRQMFHQISDIIAQEPTTPTLIVMNSKAWGYVNRLAYYISPQYPVSLLAQESAKLTPALEKLLTSQTLPYGRIIELEVAEPVWSEPTTETERETLQKILQSQYKLKNNQLLQGTMDLDEFTVNVYQRS